MPADRRPAVAALWALDEQFARIVASTHETVIGQMRLVWWRDALDALDDGPPPAQPLLQALSRDVLPAGVSGAEMAAMEEGWAALLPADDVSPEDRACHAAERGERLFALTARLLGGVAPEGAGAAWALVDLARAGDGAALAEATPARARWPRRVRPLGLLAALAARDIAAGAVERQGSPARLLSILRHRLTGG